QPTADPAALAGGAHAHGAAGCGHELAAVTEPPAAEAPSGGPGAARPEPLPPPRPRDALRVPPRAAALHAGSTRSLKILTALPSAAWPTHRSRNAGDPFGERCHDREDLCGLRLQAGCKLHQVEDRRQDG